MDNNIDGGKGRACGDIVNAKTIKADNSLNMVGEERKRMIARCDTSEDQ